MFDPIIGRNTMHRRAVLVGAGGVLAGLAGCTSGESDEGRNDTPEGSGEVSPEPTATSTESDEKRGTDDTTREIVDYEELSARGKAFVDAARDGGHRLHWIHESEEKVYVRYESDRWVRDDEPLTLESVDDVLTGVFESDAYLEVGGRYYEGSGSFGHGPYKTQFTAEEVDECTDVVDESDLSETSQNVIEVLVEQRTAWVADQEFRQVTDADEYFADQTERAEFVERVVTPENRCLKRDDRFYRVDRTDQKAINSRGYELVVVDDKPD